MTGEQRKLKGVTLVEIMVAVFVTLVAIIGAMGYRYYSILDARKAKVQITASRLGSMLLEDWRGTGGRSEPDDEFNPQNLAYGSVTALTTKGVAGPAVPDGFSSFGVYAIIVDGATYYVTLSYKDEAANGLRVLNGCVAWPYQYPKGPFSGEARFIRLGTKVNLITS
jgi:hypothetical protein